MAETADYRESHLHMGPSYDARLSQEPFGLYVEEIQREMIRRFLKEKFPKGIPRYLDFACGTGRMTSFIAPMASNALGVDVSDSMVEVARNRCPTTRFVLQDLTREPLETEPFDVASSFRFFGNAQDELRVAALAALANHLKPGGWLIINNHRNPLTLQHLMHRVGGGEERLDFTYYKMRRMLSEAGFRIVHCWGIGWWVCLARMFRPSVLNSSFARVLEPISRLAPVAPFCPDMLVIACKQR